MDQYQSVTLYIDVMKVNRMPFLVTISWAIKFGTTGWLKNAKSPTLLLQLEQINRIYRQRGFKIETIEADGQFEPLRDAFTGMQITLNKCSREEHVPVIERQIRTLKD